MSAVHKDARPEFERRFLLAHLPPDASITRARPIVDRYIVGTRLRLRRQRDEDGTVVFKLTQKLADGAGGAFRGLITTMYLSESEYNIFAGLPARELAKIRLSIPPFGVDVFEGELKGLVMAEAEFNSAEEAALLEVPPFAVREVTSDPRFTGGRLATVTRRELGEWLAEFAFRIDPE
jgi:CYTH domain-containing protein